MAEISLTLGLFGTLGFLVFELLQHERERETWQQERSQLVNTIIARTPMEAKALNAPFEYKKAEPRLPDGYESQIGL